MSTWLSLAHRVLFGPDSTHQWRECSMGILSWIIVGLIAGALGLGEWDRAKIDLRSLQVL